MSLLLQEIKKSESAAYRVMMHIEITEKISADHRGTYNHNAILASYAGYWLYLIPDSVVCSVI